MQVRNIFTDDRAVSPVIGVILMVAITVILAAVIGTFVLGLGDSLQDTSPQASFSGDQGERLFNNESGGTGVDYPVNTYAVTHDGGDSIAQSNIGVTVNGEPGLGATPANETTALWNGGDNVRAGSSVTVVGYDTSADGVGTVEITANETGGIKTTDVNALKPDDTVRVVWTASDGSSSQTLFSRDIN